MCQRVIILGAGGHGLVVADILFRMRDAGAAVSPVGYLDDDPRLLGQQLLGLPVLGTTADLPTIGHDAVVIAIGDNRVRGDFYQRLAARGQRFVTACHPRAIIAPDVMIGPGTMICAGVVINPGTRIGANVILNTGCTVDHHCQIGDHAHIAPGAHLGGYVEVGAGGLVGIGANVLPGRRIGLWAVVGGGALAARDVPAGALAVGVPARLRRRSGA